MRKAVPTGRLFFVLAGLLGLSLACGGSDAEEAVREPGPPPEEEQAPELGADLCSVEVWIAVAQPLRDRPDGAATGESYAAETVFTVAEVRDGWARMSRAAWLEPEPGSAELRGPGWLPLEVLELRLSFNDGGEAVLLDSPGGVVTTTWSYASPGVEHTEGTPLQLLGCQETWAEVAALGQRGWLAPEGRCASPNTACYIVVDSEEVE